VSVPTFLIAALMDGIGEPRSPARRRAMPLAGVELICRVAPCVTRMRGDEPGSAGGGWWTCGPTRAAPPTTPESSRT
jgi:hypothetical protein